LDKVRRGAARHMAVMVLDVRQGTGGRRLGRQLAFDLLLHRKLRRWSRGTGAAGARVGEAEAAACDGDARVKPTSGDGETGATCG
jgi:hypothetical protein